MQNFKDPERFFAFFANQDVEIQFPLDTEVEYPGAKCKDFKEAGHIQESHYTCM